MRQSAFPRDRGLRLIMWFVTEAVKSVFGTGIDMDIDIRPIAHAGLNGGNRFRRNVRIGLGEVQDQRAFQPICLVEMLVDLDAIVTNRRIDRMPHTGKIGIFAAKAEPHHTDFPRTIVSSA